jgi:uroporphyrin-III C-methyltransferase/precorrin-2 dehydrogenase/sirohydrochlorin ferrochelatase
MKAAAADVLQVSDDDYHPGLVHDAFVVIANSEDDDHNEVVVRHARAAGCVTYAHDRPDISDFAMPALIQRGPLKIAISTDAVAPALSRRLREVLEEALERAGVAVDTLVTELHELRTRLPRGKRGNTLYQLASKMRLDGHFVVDDSGE